MIVRISTEGQYELQSGDEERLKELDDDAASACGAGDEQRFRESFDRLLDFVRTAGQPVGDDRLAASDVILPPPDASLDEARAEFTGDGLIPS